MRRFTISLLALLAFTPAGADQQLPFPSLNRLATYRQIHSKSISRSVVVELANIQTLTKKSLTASKGASGQFDNARLPAVMANGFGLEPSYSAAIYATAITTSGSPTVTVTNPAGIEIGQQAFAPYLPIGSIVINVAGNAITLSQNATATNLSPVAIRFGSDRWSATSTLLANTVGAGNLYVGAAAKGNHTWMDKWSPGTDYRELSSLFVLSPPGNAGVAAFFGSRASDNNGSFGSVLNSVILSVVDASPGSKSSWGLYNEANLVSSSVGYHMNEESSVYSEWPYASTDPFSYNQLGASRNLRLDCGKGSGRPQPCSAALEIVQNGAGYGKGIVFGSDGINTYADGTKPALVMAPNHAIHWFTGNDTPGWAIVSTKTSGKARKLTLSDAAAVLSSGVDFATGGHIYGATNAPAISSCGDGSPMLSAGSTDTHGTITEGTSATGCVISFVKAFTLVPTCVVSSPTGSAFTSYTATKTTLTISNPSASGSKYSYICMGN